MTMGRDDIGVGFTGGPYSARRVAELAKLAEKEGFSSVWCAEDYYLRDAISNISCVAYVTREVKISTGVINPFSRNPVLIAETIATLNELSGGRIRLALGTGVQPLIENMGIKFSHPLQAMAESVEIVRRTMQARSSRRRVSSLVKTLTSRFSSATSRCRPFQST